MNVASNAGVSTEGPTAGRPRPRWLKPARLIVLALILAIAAVYLVGLPVYFRLLANLAPSTMPDMQWTPATLRAALAQLGLSPEAYAAARVLLSVAQALIYSLIGLLIFWRRSDGWFGLYLALQLVLFGMMSSSANDGFAEMVPASSPLLYVAGNLSWMLLPLILFTFPDGRFVPRWGAVVFAAWLILLAWFALAVPAGSGPTAPALALLLACFGTGIGGQVYRYLKVSNAVQRQQTKWVMAAMATFFIFAFVALATLRQNRELFGATAAGLTYYLTSQFFNLIITILIPLAIGIAILRYHLWDIDLIIRRTLIYGALTGLIVLVYFGAVVTLQQIFRGLTGQGDDLAIILSTLGSALLFIPLRNRVQRIIDHRFYRRKYNAARVLEAFGATVRDEVDLGRLTENLVSAVEETIQPETVSLWLRTTEDGRRRTKA